MESSDNLTPSNIASRVSKKTPKFFRLLRTIGLVIGSLGAAIIAAPVAVPAAVAGVAGYLVAGGAAIVAVSQCTKEKE